MILSSLRKTISRLTLIHPLMLRMMPARRNFPIVMINSMPSVQQNKIFVMNHCNVHDVPIACEVIREHFYVLVGKQKLELIDRIFFLLNGVVYIDRKNKLSRKYGFEKMLELLKEGHNLLIYPEGTWNMTSSKPMLPMNWGVIELSRSAGVPIVPLVVEYHMNCCNVKFGEAIYIGKEMDKETGIRRLEEVMATLRWDIWELFPVGEMRK